MLPGAPFLASFARSGDFLSFTDCPSCFIPNLLGVRNLTFRRVTLDTAESYSPRRTSAPEYQHGCV